MGASYCSIHCYTGAPVQVGQERFCCFSAGWQTYRPAAQRFEDPEQTQSIARRISRAVGMPVLWFYLFDEEQVRFALYLEGKKAAEYGWSSRNLSRVPELLDTGEDGERRLKRILECPDLMQKIGLLEEYFGVCLLPAEEATAEHDPRWRRTRGDGLYRQYEEAEQRLTGRLAPMEAVVVQELPGVWETRDVKFLFITVRVPGSPDFQPGYGLYRCANTTEARRVPTCFRGGQLEFITTEEMRTRGVSRYPFTLVTPCWTEQAGKVRFAPEAPGTYAGAELVLPAGWAVLGFAGERLLLQISEKWIAVMDEAQKIRAKLRLKGRVVAQDGAYLLTSEEQGAQGTLRVYCIRDRRKGTKK